MINNPVRKQLPTLENPGTAIDLRSGKSLIAPDGSVVTGTLPDVEQATPSISVSSGGLITATAAQVGGIVADGTKSATQQLTTQGAKTVNPGTSTQTAVTSGRYTTGAVQVAGDANLKPENIVNGKSIFGVSGSANVLETVKGTFSFQYSNRAHFICTPSGYKRLWYSQEVNTTWDILKNSFVVISDFGETELRLTGGIEYLFEFTMNYTTVASLLYVTDDFSISY